MRFTAAALLAATALLALVSCGRPAAPPATEPAPAPAPASAAVDPTAICAEHGIVEAICTKCNPALIPVFQAKGDWCAEHGFPESACPICHPEKGGRPVADLSAPAGPRSGTRITFKSLESAELAGIETAVATRGLETGGLAVLGRVVPDGSRVARINARLAGVLREVLADVGAQVARGGSLAVIESSELGAAQAHLRAAEARVNTARAESAREQELLAQRITSAQQSQVAKRALEEAEADLAAARSELSVVGSISGPSRYRLTSPIAGVVTEREASVGQMVHVDDALFLVIDPSVVKVELDLPEDALASMASGRHVVIEADSLPGRSFDGVLEYIAPAVDAATRTVKARLTLANDDGALRMNMFVRARIALAEGALAASIPAEAVHDIEGASIVFVKIAADKFETRRVELGQRDADLVTIRSGLQPGDIVATTGSFLLETELLKSSIGSGCCELD